jgi:hypothetical protein
VTAAMRAAYVVGKTGAFHIPTLLHVDIALRAAVLRLQEGAPETTVARVRADVDLLLDRRRELSEALT